MVTNRWRKRRFAVLFVNFMIWVDSKYTYVCWYSCSFIWIIKDVCLEVMLSFEETANRRSAVFFVTQFGECPKVAQDRNRLRMSLTVGSKNEVTRNRFWWHLKPKNESKSCANVTQHILVVNEVWCISSTIRRISSCCKDIGTSIPLIADVPGFQWMLRGFTEAHFGRRPIVAQVLEADTPCCILPFKGKLPSLLPVPVFVLGIKDSSRRQNIAFASEASWRIFLTARP